MNSNPEEDFLDRRLRGRITSTSADLEARFERIRFQPGDTAEQITEEPSRFFPPIFSLFPLGAAAAVLVLGLLWFHWNPLETDSYSGTEIVFLEDPFYWDQALAPGRVILDEDTFHAILHLPHDDDNS